jgi:uncharacterized protein with PIN domain
MKFILDGMLGSLTRWLRMIGHDASYVNDARDRDLVAKATNERRILLTSDIALFRLATARGAEAYLVKGRTEAERLAGLASRFKLTLSVETAESRCPTCGSSLNATSKEQIKDKVPATTFNVFSEFWTCSNPSCGQIYWKGSHWENINAVLKEAKRIQKRNESANEDREK